MGELSSTRSLKRQSGAVDEQPRRAPAQGRRTTRDNESGHTSRQTWALRKPRLSPPQYFPIHRPQGSIGEPDPKHPSARSCEQSGIGPSVSQRQHRPISRRLRALPPRPCSRSLPSIKNSSTSARGRGLPRCRPRLCRPCFMLVRLCHISVKCGPALRCAHSVG